MTDWKPGDLALCINGANIEDNIIGSPDNPDGYPTVGRIYVIDSIGVRSLGKAVFLYSNDFPWNHFRCYNRQNRHFVGWANKKDKCWCESRFVKVTPEEIDDEDIEVITLMNSPINEEIVC